MNDPAKTTKSERLAQKKIRTIDQSIALQVRTRENLKSMSIDTTDTVQLCERIIASLKAQRRIYEMQA